MIRKVVSLLGIVGATIVLTVGGEARDASASADRIAGDPVTIDFESGVSVGAKITNQYGAPTVPAGPTFIDPYPAGIGAGCAPPELTTTSGASSGTRAALLSGCANGEFYATGAVIAMGYSVQDVELKLKGSPNEVFVTGLRADRTVAVQQRGFLPNGGSMFGTVTVQSPTGSDLAYLVIETGTLGNGGSPTGVVQAIGTQLLVLDDLRYTPPSSPPASSFSLAASPPSQRVGKGDTATATIPVTWVNNPSPSSSPIQFDVAAPAGVSASITPNPTTSGVATLTMKVSPTAKAGFATVVVTGFVDKGTPFEKTATVSVELLIEQPFAVQILPGPAPTRCTASTWQVRIPLSSTASGNLTIRLDAAGAVRITGVDDKPIPPTTSITLSRPATQTGVVSIAVALAALGSGQSGTLTASVGNGGASASLARPVRIAAGTVVKVETTDTAKMLTAVSAPMYRRPGSTVRLIGTGFCAGAAVQFGKTGGRVAASTVAQDGRSLVVTVPRLAVSGLVEVVNKVSGIESVLPSTVSLRVDTFRSRYAYSFKNYEHGSFGTEVLADAFGDDEIFIKVDVCAALTLGVTSCPAYTSILDPHAFVVWLMLKDSGGDGVCYGMSLSEGKFATGASSPSSYPSKIKPPSTWQLIGPAAPTIQLDRLIAIEHLKQASGQSISAAVSAELNHGSGVSYAAWMRDVTLAGLTKGVPMIVSIRDDGAGHAMLVYDLEDLGNAKYRLYLADPNIPFVDKDLDDPAQHEANELTSSIVVDGQASSWSYPNLVKDDGGKKVPWSDTVSGDSILVFPADVAYTTNPSLPSLFQLGKALIILASDGSRLEQVSDGNGRRLLAADGDALKGQARIPGSALVGPTEATATSGPMAVLTRQGVITARATRAVGNAGRLSAISPSGTIATVAIGGSRVPAGGSATRSADVLTLQPGISSATFEAGSSASTSITVSTRSRKGAVVAATVTGPVAAGSSDTLSIRAGTATLVHAGPARVVDFTLTTRGANGIPQSATISLGRIVAGERLEVLVGRSGTLGRSLAVRRTAGGRTISSTVALRKAKAQVAIRSAAVSARAGRVSVRVGVRVPRRATAAGTTVIVLAGNRVVAKGVTHVSARDLRGGRGTTRWLSPKLSAGRYRVIVVASSSQSGTGATATTTRSIVVKR